MRNRFIIILFLLLSATLGWAEEARLPVQTVTVLGNTLLPESELTRVTSPYEGRQLTVGELKKLTSELEQLYKDEGYILVQVLLPTQVPKEGLLVVQVVEPEISALTVEGNSRYSEEFLARRFRGAVPEGEVYRSQNLERAMLLLNELPDVSVKALMRPGEEPASTEVVLQVEEEKPYHFTLDYNNFGTRLTGEHRMGLTADFSSVVTGGDSLVLGGLIATPASGTAFLQGSYSFPVGDQGTRLGLGYANGNYTVGRELQILDIRGDADIFTLSLSHPLARSLSHSSDVSLSLSYNDIRNQAVGRPLSEDNYTAARLDYTSQWSDPDGRTVLHGGVSQGLGGIRAGDPRASRLGAGADFTKFRIDAARVQQFDEAFMGILRAGAQLSGETLFSAEQLAMGGPDTVRGFTQAEVLGDKGYLVSAELRWSPLPEDRDLFQTVLFMDHGGVTQDRPAPGLPGSTHLTGAGFGFRVNYEQTRVRLDLGFPLTPRRNQRNLSPVLYGQVVTRF